MILMVSVPVIEKSVAGIFYVFCHILMISLVILCVRTKTEMLVLDGLAELTHFTERTCFIRR